MEILIIDFYGSGVRVPLKDYFAAKPWHIETDMNISDNTA